MSNTTALSVLDTFTSDLLKEIDLLENTEPLYEERPEDYERSHHWNKIGLCCELVSKECTKMSLAFSKPPLPTTEDTQLLLRDIGKAVDMLLAWYKTFPLEEGRTLHCALTECISSILSSVCEFVESSCGKRNKKHTLRSTGTVWEHCDLFQKLPQDNISAVIMNFDTSYKLIDDAIKEVQQTLREFEEDQLNDIDDYKGDDDDNDGDKWTEDDKTLIKPSIGLMMASKGLFKKSKNSLCDLKKKMELNSRNLIAEVDVLMEHLKVISPAVDDFAMSLYPPANRHEVENQAKDLTSKVHNALLFAKNSSCLGYPDNESWLTFIGKAIDHNFEKLKSLTSPQNTI